MEIDYTKRRKPTKGRHYTHLRIDREIHTLLVAEADRRGESLIVTTHHVITKGLS